MEIKKFTASTLQEAVFRMKKELGEDALVLRSQSVQDSVFNYCAKGGIEIFAAADTTPAAAQLRKPAIRPVSAGMQPAVPPVMPPAGLVGPGRTLPSRELEILRSDVNTLKSSMGQIADFLKYRNLPGLPEKLMIVHKQLIDNDVDERLARKLVQEIHTQLHAEEYLDLKRILLLMVDKIKGFIHTLPDPLVKPGRPHVTALIGPTGVGKTTTLAKLATNAKLFGNARVAIISADTFRIAAVEQLRTFANIADIPLEVCYNEKDMKGAVARYKDFEYIFIDTCGRSQRDEKNLREIKTILKAAAPNDLHLVLSVSTKYKDMLDVIDRFQIMPFTQLLFTKLDETTNIGVILNVLHSIKKPVAYLTTGQNVPEDIEKVQSDKLARMILRRKFL